MLWEKHCFGRPANQEIFASGHVLSEIEIRDAEKLIFTEKQRIDADELNRSSGLRSFPVMGSFLIYGPVVDKSVLDSLRNLSPLEGVCGLTQLKPELIIARYMGNSTRDIDAYFVRLWERLRPLVMQRKATHPRIWKT